MLVAEDGEPFLQRELEPVAAGDAVARPVVEVLVGDDGLDALIVAVGRRLRPSQDEFGVEDVEALVLHRAHVEVGNGGDVEDVEVVFKAVDLLVPLHGALEAVHGVGAAILVAAPDPDVQDDVAAGLGGEVVGDGDEVARDQRKEVGRLGVRVFPARPMPAVLALARAGRVAVGEQHRVARLVGRDGDGETRHHVRTVGEVGDAAEAFGLALGEEIAAGGVEAGELGVPVGRDPGFRFEHEDVGGARDGEGAVLADRVVRVGQGHAVHLDAEQG